MKKLARVLAYIAVAVTVVWLGVCAWLSATHPRVSFSDADMAAAATPLPAGFLWGTATSAHQIEGGTTNDWTRFEAEPGRIERGETSAVAADAWRRMFDDIALMKQIHANAYRFSIEWSRVEPRDGTWDEAAWSRYAAFAKELRAQGITPMVTLFHFTLPVWIADRGGLAAADFPDRFARYAGEAGRRFGPDVDLWLTFNEPNVQLYVGYVAGQWPPLLKSTPDAIKAYLGLLRAHAAGARALRVADPGCQIGLANNLMLLEPKSRLMLGDWAAASLVDRFWNWPFADAIRDGRARLRLPDGAVDEPMPELIGSTDFFGLNYYFRYLVRPAPSRPEMVAMEPGPGLRSELGGNAPVGDSPPEALFALMREAWRRYRQPIYITEGGIADDAGAMRAALIRGQRIAIGHALAEGISVKGYMHWSLMDNFEWEKGYRPRFGLFRVDRATMARTPTAGAEAFAALAPPVARPSLPGWTLAWGDEFDQEGRPDASKWVAETGGHGWGNREQQFYTKDRLENARVEGGRLVIEARRDNHEGHAYTSARLNSKVAWRYGRIEVRAKLPSGRGTWPAAWMLNERFLQGGASWPDSGEIDIMEHVGHDPDVVHASIHTKAFNHVAGTQRTARTSVPGARDGFHVYAVEWGPESIRALVDDREYFRFDKPAGAGVDQWPFDQPFRLLLNLAVGGTWGGAQGVDESIWPQRLEVDYVRVYQAAAAR